MKLLLLQTASSLHAGGQSDTHTEGGIAAGPLLQRVTDEADDLSVASAEESSHVRYDVVCHHSHDLCCGKIGRTPQASMVQACTWL